MRIGILFRFVIFHLIVFTVLRLVFFMCFQGSEELAGALVIKALTLGFKFDLRLTLLLVTPLFLVGWGTFSPYESKKSARRWLLFYSLLAAVWTVIYIVDIGHYSYLRSRVNSTVLSNLENPDIAIGMMWESYPVIWVMVGFLITMLLYAHFLRRFVFIHYRTPYFMFPPSLCYVVFIAAYLAGLYGNLSQYPLRWSEAFFSPQHFLSHLSLNPVLYFAETYSFNKKDNFDIKRTKELYPVMAPYLGVQLQNTEPLNFARDIAPSSAVPHPYNVVVIVMESMAMSKTNLMENPLKPTPALEELAQESYWFSNYYSPAESTARNMFSIMTAIPDVTRTQTSSRNPLVVDQRLIINSFKDYRKMYFLGGSASWANIRGIFSNNIDDIEIYEEGYFNKGRTDVWGVSDLDLFIEANKVFESVPQDKPFFAVIQSASFHRPYTIPDDAKKFKVKTAKVSELVEAGFGSEEQYNSLRFSDYSLGYFFEQAKKSPYYKNTLFIVTGDHGLPDENGINVPKGSHLWELEKYHVPLILHNAELFPQTTEDQKPASHLDMMTTAAYLAGIPHTNTTLGRNLFDLEFDKERYSFIYNFYSQIGEYYLVNNDFYYRYDNVKKGQLYRHKSDTPEIDVKAEFPAEFERMSAIAEGYLQSSRYLLFNNKKPAK